MNSTQPDPEALASRDTNDAMFASSGHGTDSGDTIIAIMAYVYEISDSETVI